MLRYGLKYALYNVFKRKKGTVATQCPYDITVSCSVSSPERLKVTYSARQQTSERLPMNTDYHGYYLGNQ